MKVTFAVGLTGLYAALAAAWTTPVGDTPSGNPIFTPGLNEQVPVGSPYAISWNPTTSGTVTILLLRGPSENVQPMYAIVENTANSGSYMWTPSTSLENDSTHYGIEIIDDATGAYQYSTQFGISNPNAASSSAVASSAMVSSSPAATPRAASSATFAPDSVSTSAAAGGDVIYSTTLITLTSCGPAVTNCPASSHAPTAVPTGGAPAIPSAPYSAGWNNTVPAPPAGTGIPSGAASPSGALSSTPVFAPSSTPSNAVFTGAADKVRAGGFMIAAVAGLAVFLL